MVRRILFAAVVAGVLLALLEMAGRWWVPRAGGTTTPMVFDPALGWALPADARFTWMGMEVTTNRLGLRGHDPWPVGSRPEPVRRVLVLGDSSVFGHGVGDDDTFPRQLESMLEDQGPADVQNGGVPGYTCGQGLKLFKRLLPDFSPDVVVVYHLHSDRRIASGRDVVFPGAALPLLGWSGAGRLAAVLGFRLRVRLGGPATPLGDYTRCLVQVARLQTERGMHTVFALPPADVDLPLPGETWGPEPGAPGTRLADYRDAMAQVATQEKALLVDLPAAFQRAGLGRVDLLQDSVHPTAMGQYVVARALLPAIEDNPSPDLPEPPRPDSPCPCCSPSPPVRRKPRCTQRQETRSPRPSRGRSTWG